MKTRRLALLSLTILVSIMLGAFALNLLSAREELKLKVKWNPVEYTLDTPPPDPWNAGIWFAPPLPLDQINASTILLEGKYAPESPPYPRQGSPTRLVVPFHGYDVLEALMAKAPHMAPGQYRIWLEIAGQLYDGTPFRGSGGINVLVPESSPP